MNSKAKPKGSIGKFLEQELYGVPEQELYEIPQSKDENQINNNKFFTGFFDDLVGLSILSKYNSYDLAIYSIFVFVVEIFVFASIFSPLFDYPVFFIPFFIPLIYNLLIAIILKLTIYKETRNFDEFVRWIASVARFGIMLPLFGITLPVIIFLTIVLLIIVFIIIGGFIFISCVRDILQQKVKRRWY